ncbi:hypothetical protein FACS1894195_4310 [Bacteroidia bacterium]|nr:hypothetical protein FACS1894195_4310 [Bacteroidia bacterium]
MLYIISEKATADIEQIWLYTYFQWSEQQAVSPSIVLNHDIVLNRDFVKIIKMTKIINSLSSC